MDFNTYLMIGLGVILIIFLINQSNKDTKETETLDALEEKMNILKKTGNTYKQPSLRKKRLNTKYDLEKFLLKKDSGYKDEFKFLKGLIKEIRAVNILDEEGMRKYIIKHYKKLNENKLLLVQTKFKDLEAILGTYLNDIEDKNKVSTNQEFGEFDFTISFDDVEQFHSYTQVVYGIAGALAMEKISKKGDFKEGPSEKEIKEINTKDYGKLSPKQVKDRQVYGAIRAYAEIMKVDGDFDPNEMMKIGELSEKEQKKLSDDYSQDSDEFKFVWASEENVFTSLKTYNKKEIKSFFDNLFMVAASDGKVKDSEIDFMVTMYKNITDSDEKKSYATVLAMYKDWYARLKAGKVEVFEQEIDTPFEIIEDVPLFPGCERAAKSQRRKCFQEQIQKHIIENFRYPEIAQEMGIQGRVFVQFMIGKDGSISEIKTKGPDELLEKEANRIISKLPKMIPGKQNGRPVRVPMSIPITFKLN